MIGSYLFVAANFYLWQAVFNSSETGVLSGFDFRQMVVYILLAYAVSDITRSSSGWIVGSEVKDGSIAMNLIRPISYSTRIFFTDLGANAISVVTSAALPFLVVGIFFHDMVSLRLLPVFILSIFLSFCIRHFFGMCFSMISFYTTYVWGLQLFLNAFVRFLSGVLVPFAFFPDAARQVFELLPFAGMVYTPIMIFLGQYSGETLLFFLGLQVFWLLVFSGLSVVLWRWAIKRLTILGG